MPRCARSAPPARRSGIERRRPGWAIANAPGRTHPCGVLERIEARLEAARSADRPIDLAELEDLYTTGCAEVLELEAQAARMARQLRDLREQLRHVRTAIEWLQEERAAGDVAQ